MARVSPIQLIQQREQPVVGIRTKNSLQELPLLIGSSYAKIASYLGELGELPSEVPYVAYHNFQTMKADEIELEIGFPVSKLLPAKDEIKTDVLPALRAIFCLYRGSYGDTTAIYEELNSWMIENRVKAAGPCFEYYYSGPDSPVEEHITKILIPLQD